MSIQAMAWVLQHSETTAGERLVLLSLANYARDDGTKAWPSVASLARDARLSRSQVQRCLRKLEAGGHIVETEKHRTGTHVYTVVMGGPQYAAGGGRICDEGGPHQRGPILQ